MTEYSDEFRIGEMCRAMEVSRGGFYRWLNRFKSRREIENEELLNEIRVEFQKGRRTYGSPSITKELKKRGRKVNKKRVARIMKENGLRAKTKRKFKVTTHSDHKEPISPNLLNQDFTAEGLNMVWVSDITYVWTREAMSSIFEYIEVFYNRIRRHTTIGSLSPAEFEARLLQRSSPLGQKVA